MLTAEEFVKDKEALTDAARLDQHRRRSAEGSFMHIVARFILAFIMTAVMVFMVTLIVTFINLGLRGDFLSQWVKAYFIAWPIAAVTAFFIMPSARRVTDGLMRKIGA